MFQINGNLEISYPHIQSTLEKCLSIQMNDVLFCGLANLNILSGGGQGESVLILFACSPGSGRVQSEPKSSELEVSTIAGDRAEDLELGKGEGGPREGAEDAGPREGDNCSRANGVDRQHWFLGQLNVLSNDLLHDLVEGVLTCCSSTDSDLKLHLFVGVVIFEIVD